MTAVRSGRRPLARVLIALAGGLLSLLTGCGSNTAAPPGTPVLTMSSTNTGFAGYVVLVSAITLAESNGGLVSPVFTPLTIDLARLTDIAEVLGAPGGVPAGTYLSVQITIDYTNASIWANVDGQAKPLAARAPGGAGITSTILKVTFDPAHPLVIKQGVSTRAHVTFDLDAFNTVDLTTSPATVTVQPYALMQPALPDATPLRARGVFVTVEEGDFVINLRPFYDFVSNPSGAMTVKITDKTYFSVENVVYTGGPGLNAMKGLNINTPVAAYGTLDNLSGITPTFNATAVYAGESLEGGLQDHFIGVVAARSGNTLTVHNIQWLPVQVFSNPPPQMLFLPTATVTVGGNTFVTEDGNEAAGASLQSISVGQRVDVAGVSSTNVTTQLTSMNATAGQLRLQSTRAWGVLKSATPNSAVLDLLSLGNFSPASYTFTGTATGGGAVDPALYPVNTGTLDESATAAGTLLAVDGLVAPFGAAPPAFNATAITAGAATQQELVVEWVSGGASAPFSQHDAAGLVVDLSNANLGTVHAIYTGPQSLDLKPPSLPASPLITTTGANQSKLLLAVGNATLGITEFQSAAAFATALNSALNGTNKVYRLAAFGQYNSASNTFVATRIDVALHN